MLFHRPKSYIKSYVKRNGRLTATQKEYLKNINNNKNYTKISVKKINFQNLFNNTNQCILDIGFGDGMLLINIANKYPNINFIGIEVYEQGIVNILKQIDKYKLSNLRIINNDAILVLQDFIKNKTLYGVSLFFPDPWPKKKHNKRRIINNDFLNLISKKIIKKGFIKIVTDWTNYADNIISLFNNNNKYLKISDIYIYKERDLTKFEKKGMSCDHKITNLCYELI